MKVQLVFALCCLIHISKARSRFREDILHNKECFGHSIQLREACPEANEDKDKCRELGCCYDDTFPTAFKCFKRRPYTDFARCSVSPDERVSCTHKRGYGYLRVSEWECKNKGCCYDDTHSNSYDVPECFMRQEMVDLRCAVPEEKRKVCSYGADLKECLNLGCCYDANSESENKCYSKDWQYAEENCRIAPYERERLNQYVFNEIGCIKDGHCFEKKRRFAWCYYGKDELEKRKKEEQLAEIERMKSVPIEPSEIKFNHKLVKQHQNNEVVEFCWATTYGRGVGLIPTECGEFQKQGLLCYPKCKLHYTGLLFVCWQDCPEGYADHGAFCFKPPPYGRGWGYPWIISDGFSDAGMFERCNADNKELGCEKWGAVVYPKCKKGYHNVGCCICSPDCKDGQVDIGISCAKKSYTRATILPDCTSDQEYDFGLCYKKCDKGYNGVGPVCWGSCPAATPVNCGMGCAIDHETCMWNLFDQVTSAIDVVVTIGSTVVTAGGSLAAKAAAQTSAKLAAKAVMKKVSKYASKEAIEKTIKVAAKEVGKTVAETGAASLAENIVSLEIGKEDEIQWDTLDPSGIWGMVNSYNHPICKYN